MDNKNVYNITQDRLKILFEEFDNVYVSFSGGKDSGVLLNLCIDYIRKHDLKIKLGVFHIDYEAQYQMTTDYVNKVFSENLDILDIYHCCMPLHAQCATSMQQSYWVPWEKDKKDIWVRDMPNNSINEDNHQFDFWKPMSDYDFQAKFSQWYHKKKNAKRTACLVGIRTQESLNRWRAIHSDRNYKKYNNINWTKEMYPNVYNGYPIFDWITEDIWTANSKFTWSYNRLYDLYYKAGLSVDKMRVASPFNDCAGESLKLYRVIDPNNWGKMIGRVNGVNFTGIYGGTTAMGWHSIKLPKNHTWKTYMEFLLSTLPKHSRDNYIEKLNTSIKFWKTKGGVLSVDIIEKLKAAGVKVEVGKDTNYKTDKLPVRMDYIDDIDIAEAKDIPTYKRMCICIMKNDHLCKYMGFSQTKAETIIRKNVIDKYKALTS
jgi:predicted phosphoadenosine phosphosulfate sulfurtransferase